MRILILTQHYPPSLNGYAIQCADTSKMLSERGHNVFIVTCRNDEGYTNFNDNVCRCLTYSPSEGYKSFKPRYLLRQIKRRNIFIRNRYIVKKIALEFKPQIVYVWQFDCIGIGILQEIQNIGLATVCNIGDNLLAEVVKLLKNDTNYFWRLARRFLYGTNIDKLNLSNLILVSNEQKKYYIRNGFSKDQITVIHNGIDSNCIVSKLPAVWPKKKVALCWPSTSNKGCRSSY